jgi:hypothetical protein
MSSAARRLAGRVAGRHRVGGHTAVGALAGQAPAHAVQGRVRDVLHAAWHDAGGADLAEACDAGVGGRRSAAGRAGNDSTAEPRDDLTRG